MDFQMLLKNRRSIREFQDKDVPLDILKEIIQDSCLAPTSGNGQPCRFVIVRNKAFIKKLSDESKRSYLSDIAKNPVESYKKYENILKVEEFNVFYNAPCLVFIIGPAKIRSLHVDCALTVAYFMLSATSRGLGSCWIGLGDNIQDPRILDDMGIPGDCSIVAPIAVGYPVSIPPIAERHAPIIVRVIE
jgi:nitroreductase